MFVGNIALFIVPCSIARSLAKLEIVLASWAERRQQSSLAIRLSGPVSLPGKEIDVWVFETTSSVPDLFLNDLSLRTRAVVSLRLTGNGTTQRAISCVVTRGEEARAETSSNVETFIASGAALGAFEGPLAPEALHDGWLTEWVDAHVQRAEIRCVRWNHNRRIPSAGWPYGYGLPTEDEWRNSFDGADSIDGDLDPDAPPPLTASQLAQLRERFDRWLEAENYQGSLSGGGGGGGDDDEGEDNDERRLAKVATEVAATDILSAARSIFGVFSDDRTLGRLQGVLIDEASLASIDVHRLLRRLRRFR